LKVVIAGSASQKTCRMIAAKFPAAWQIVTVPVQSLMDEIGDADALIPEGSPVDVELLERAGNLKIIQTGTGYDNVNIEACRRRGIPVANAAGINPRALAERFQFFAKNITRVEAGKSPLNELLPLTGADKEASRTIPAVVLPEGYNGKILLVSISGDGFEEMVALRSGDLWHREILRNTQTEIGNLGFRNARVHELGGAQLRFEPDGNIIIHGTSQQYGACDKEYAARLVRHEFPGRQVEVRP